MTPATADRSYDVVVFGATGFTGQLVAEYLSQRRPPELRWALAGRSRDKLERVRTSLAATDERLRALPLLVADSEDEAALQRLAGSTRVVCTTVGPYALHGKKLLAACADRGTHYCDITGEVPFVRWAIDTQHARAQATGARIVTSCGTDSIPSDLGVLLVHESLRQRGARLAAAKLSVDHIKGGFSGGTAASFLQICEAAERDPAVRRLLSDPYALQPTSARGTARQEAPGVRWDAELLRWTAPFVMALVNTRVVHRTNALLGFAYGTDFRYDEVQSFPRGAAGFAAASGLASGLLAVAGMASWRGTRAILKASLPAPGQGPSLRERTEGGLRVRVLGRSAPDATACTLRAQADIEFFRDPGYSETAKMLAESALSLAFDELPPTSGLLTPAACMGRKLIERLRAREQVWQVAAT